MTTWLTKAKRIILAFLGTQDDKYLTTEDGLLLQIIGLNEYSEQTKSTTNWN